MDLDFNSDFIEEMILKKATTDKKYLSVLSNVFDIRWWKNKNVGVLLDLSVLYFRKYSAVPSPKILQALLQKAIASRRYIEGRDAYRNYKDDIEYADVSNTLLSSAQKEINLPEEAVNSNACEYMKERALYYTFSDNMEYMEKTKSVDKCLKVFEKFQKMSFTPADLGLSYFDEEQMKGHWDFIMNPEAKISTGLKSVDEYTNGGFLKSGKSLYVFMGQAGLGKSLFLSNLATHFLESGLSVVVVSLEMSENVYAMRFDAHISGHNINRLMENNEDVRFRIREFYEKHPESQLFIKEYPPRSIRTSDIEIYLENLKNAGKKFDVIVIDYLNLVLPGSKCDTMYEAGLNVSEQLRALSYKYEVPVVTAVQANSEGMNNENIDMEHISESRGIAHTVDFLAGLYQTDDDRREGIINCRILKNRLGGQVGKICSFKLDGSNLRLEDTSSVRPHSEAEEIQRNLGDISEAINNI